MKICDKNIFQDNVEWSSKNDIFFCAFPIYKNVFLLVVGGIYVSKVFPHIFLVPTFLDLQGYLLIWTA